MRAIWILGSFTLALAAIPCTAARDANAVLWQAPGTITIQDWIWGPGGESHAPKGPFEFVEEDLKGTNAKIRVRDAKGDQWTVKFGEENHSEVFASRLLFALGYVAEPSYFVESGVITGAHNLRRAKPFVGKDGAFSYARFKLRDHKAMAHVDGQTWSWTDNPFVGTQELNGLKILLMLTSNWDAKDSRDGAGSNTSVFTKRGSSGQLYYAFDDWGATMGRWGGFFKRDKWNAAGYQQQSKKFIRGTRDASLMQTGTSMDSHERVETSQTIEWGYRGKHVKDVTSGIRVADVRWLLTYLSRVTDPELRAGLRASGATEPEIDIYARSLRERIQQLERLSGPAVSGRPAVAAAPDRTTPNRGGQR